MSLIGATYLISAVNQQVKVCSVIRMSGAVQQLNVSTSRNRVCAVRQKCENPSSKERKQNKRTKADFWKFKCLRSYEFWSRREK